jgi:hypothetical protein
MAIISNAVTIADAGAFSVSLGSMVHIKTLTASASATLSFVHGTDGVVLDSTYPIYKFEFINIHPATNEVDFKVGFRDGGTLYDATKTTTSFGAYHDEVYDDSLLLYSTGDDLAQSTAAQPLFILTTSSDNDHASNGELRLYNPSSTTFVKHFISRTVSTSINDYSVDSYVAGYCNVTAAIDGVQFSMSSGNIDAGNITFV